MPVPDGEFHRVLFVDGIWLAERLVALICCSEDRVVSWYMAQSENSRAWSALMEPIPAPDVVVTDGGSGFAKAVRAAWPRTKVQSACLDWLHYPGQSREVIESEKESMTDSEATMAFRRRP